MRRRAAFSLLVLLAIVVLFVAAARWPVTTAVGDDYRVTLKRVTVFEKAVAFIHRDLEMRRLTKEIAGSDGTPERRLLRMYDWVITNIHSVPPGLPVIDDHVLHIFVRRYGETDQRAEALAVLATYDDMPATALGLGIGPVHRPVQLTVVRLDDRLVVFDVNNRIVFRQSSGRLATLHDLAVDPSIVKAAGRDLKVAGVPYPEYFRRLGEIKPSFVRMEKQRLWPRLKGELVELLPGS